jgi:AcrR family transcriptional regulator
MSRLADPGLAERRRRQILDAAVVCFRRRGFHQATMQEICSEAGMSPGALYRYFGSKSDIIAAIAEDEQDNRFVALEEVANVSVIDLMCRGARHYFEKLLMHDQGALMADVFAEVARDPLLARSLRKLDERRVAVFADRIRVAQISGEVDPALDPLMASQTLCAAIEGIGLRHALNQQSDLDRALEQVRSLAERYLGAGRHLGAERYLKGGGS